MTLIDENMAEQATLDWFDELGYAIGHWQHLVYGELWVKAGEPYVAVATP